MSDLVYYQRDDHVARITLNRPEKRNALSGPMVDALQDGLDRVEHDESARVVVLTGEGAAFSAGADLESLRRMQTVSVLENADDSERLAALFSRIYTFPKPVIARVNGHAIAGGCGLAAVCDFSIAADGARLGFTEVRIGFVPAIVMVFAVRKIGEAAARRLMLTGELITADEAVELSLINRSVPESELDDKVDALAAALAKNTSASAIRLTKQMMARIPGMGLDEGLEYAARMNAFARSTDDCRAGVAAFLDKTDPPWKR